MSLRISGAEAGWGGYYGTFSDPDGYLWKVATSAGAIDQGIDSTDVLSGVDRFRAGAPTLGLAGQPDQVALGVDEVRDNEAGTR